MKNLFLHIRLHARWYLLLLLFIASIVVWTVVFREDRGGKLTVSFLDIGQGDSIFVESPTGIQVIVDGGPDKNLMRELPKVMPWYDTHVDMLIITNPDKDHYSGFIPLLERYTSDVVLEPGVRPTNDTYAFLEKEISDKGVPDILARRGQIIDIGGGAYIRILFPDRDASAMSSNDASIVAQLVYGNTSVMLQGDSTIKIEHYMIGLEGDSLKSTILKVGHHGSRTSTSEEYVKTVSPEYAVISAGVGNSYGHPHKETLDTLEKLNVPVLGTYTMGRITFVSDGQKFKQIK